MLALLFLAAAAQAIPAPKIIPVFELTELQTRVALENIGQLKSACLNDCHHHILDQPVYIIAQPEINGQYLVHYTPLGLNSLGRSPTTVGFNEHLLAEQPMVTLLAPLGKFPFELFPGILEQDLAIPEHHTKLIDMYRFKDAPVLAIIPEAEFKKITEQKVFTQVADLVLQDNVYRIGKDYALAHRLAPAPTVQPTIQPTIQPTVLPDTDPQYFRFTQNPILDLHRVKFVPLQHFNPLELRTPVIPQPQIHQIPQIAQYPLFHQQDIL